MTNTNDVIVAAYEHRRKIRDGLIDLRGIEAVLYVMEVARPAERVDMWGDVKNETSWSPGVPEKIVIETGELHRLALSVEEGSDEFSVPFSGEMKMGTKVKEGDIMRLRYIWDEREELKFMTVSRVDQFMHVRPISKIVKLTQYRGDISGFTEPALGG